MGHDTVSSRQRRSLLVLMLGALACGDEGALILPPGDGAVAPAAAAPPAAANEAIEATPSTSSAERSPASAPAGSNGERVPDPVMLEAERPPASGGSAQEGTSAPPAELPPAEPAAELPPGGPSPAEEGPRAEAPPGEAPPGEEEPAAEAPSGSPPLTAGDDPTRASAATRGPFEVAVVTSGLRDGPDYGSQTLHVPEGAAPPFAAVVVVPGRDEDESSIRAWGPFLASHGIVTLTFGTNDPGDGPEQRARALLDALTTLRAENAREGGPLESQLALDRLGVMGWSAGGAAVLRVASSTPSLRAAIALAPYSPGDEFPEDEVPTLLLAGSADRRAGGQSQAVFESLPDATPKLLFEVDGGQHEIGNDPRNAAGEVGLYGLSWLEVFLVGDERYRLLLDQAPAQASDFRASWGDAR